MMKNKDTIHVKKLFQDFITHKISMEEFIKKGNQFGLISIEQYATSHQYPMLVLLNTTNVLYQSRKHLIGIVPLSQGDKVHMHIVEGSHPPKKTIPLNQTNLGWCSGDISCFVDRVVVFLPGKNYQSATKENKLIYN